MLATWRSAVRSLMVSRPAMSRLDSPCATRIATSRSRDVKPPYRSLAVWRGDAAGNGGNRVAERSRNCARSVGPPSAQASSGNVAASVATLARAALNASSASVRRRWASSVRPSASSMRHCSGNRPCACATTSASRSAASASPKHSRPSNASPRSHHRRGTTRPATARFCAAAISRSMISKANSSWPRANASSACDAQISRSCKVRAGPSTARTASNAACASSGRSCLISAVASAAAVCRCQISELISHAMSWAGNNICSARSKSRNSLCNQPNPRRASTIHSLCSMSMAASRAACRISRAAPHCPRRPSANPRQIVARASPDRQVMLRAVSTACRPAGMLSATASLSNSSSKSAANARPDWLISKPRGSSTASHNVIARRQSLRPPIRSPQLKRVMANRSSVSASPVWSLRPAKIANASSWSRKAAKGCSRFMRQLPIWLRLLASRCGTPCRRAWLSASAI